MGLVKLIHGDCIEKMKDIESSSIDMVMTSPPYDNLRDYGKDFAGWGEHIWKPCLNQIFRVLKDGGVCVWVVGDATINGSETGTSFRQALYWMEIGGKLHDTMIWEKTGMLPTQDRYYAIFEYMFVFSKGKPKSMNFIEDKQNTAGGRGQKKDAVINKGKQKDGTGCFVRKHLGRRTNIWRIAIGKHGTLKKCKEKCQEIWEGIVMEAWEENKGCEYCLKDTKSLIDEAGEDKGLKSFLETRIEGNSLCTYADIRSEYQEGEKKINYCPMCGRRLEEE